MYLILLPTIYILDVKAVLGWFIQRWSGELMRIDDMVIPCPLLHLESLPSTPPRFLGLDPLQEIHIYIPYALELHNFISFVVVSL